MCATTKSNPKTACDYRVGLLRKGYTVRGWARDHGHRPVTVHYAIHGKRGGAKSRAIIRDINQFLK